YVCKNAECGFKAGHTIAGRTLSHAEMATLLKNGKSDLLSGFKSKKGTDFSAKLSLDKDFNITFEFESDGKFHGQKTNYKCPLCGETLEENKNAIFCPACNFTLFKSMAGKKLRVADIKALLTDGKTELLTGFKSKKGTEFDAYVKLGADGRTSFEFVHRDLPCPCCGDQLRFRSGTVTQNANGETTKTLAAYVCMNPACNYGIPKTFFQRDFTDEEVETLLKNKSTPILEPFKKNDTTFRAALELREGGKIAFNKLTVEVIKKG
ncbi:MAG: topoisomerase C-terminal repeat-containing protein, partial [Fibrobacter sp.]|nr:topoisomerase C-terminal repeat-containing protein [Fibrobacter sp.]